MTAVDVVPDYALIRDWPIFPVGRDKRPLTERSFYDATTDPDQLVLWFARRWPDALIASPTGTNFVVLDVDVKHPGAYGFDTLADLGVGILPDTPIAHTPSGGCHLYFCPGPHDIPNTGGAKGRGIGPGLDWRGAGGSIILPSPGSGYWWDPHQNFDTVPLAEVPQALLPKPVEPRVAVPVQRTTGLSRYAEAALLSACNAIVAAPAGQQEVTLNSECFAIGTFAGAGGIPESFARRALQVAASRIKDHDTRRPWRARELERKVDQAFCDGLSHPRETRHA
jgi:Bifunctional DNA primase/polymerase, N-terminal